MTTSLSSKAGQQNFRQSLVTHSRFDHSLSKSPSLRTSVNKDESIWKSFLATNPVIKFLRPDFYVIFRYDDQGKILYQENISLDLGGKEVTLNSIYNLMVPADLQHIRQSDEVMSNLVRERKLQPWDFVYKICGSITCPNPQLKRLMRTSILIHRDHFGQASIGFMCFHDISGMVSTIKPNGFELSTEPDLQFLSDEMEARLKKFQDAQVKVTHRESEIIQCIRKGMNSKEIASSLYISVATVNTHRQNMLRKWEVPNTAALLEKLL